MGFLFDVEAATEVTDLMLHEFAEEQLPFATAVTVTRLARKTVIGTREAMPRRFNLRSRRVPKGIQFNRAEKKDWPNVSAEAGILDEFMVRQETGGIRKPKRGGRFIAVPTRIVRRTATGRIRKAQLPRSISSSKTGFFADGQIQRRKTKARRVGIYFNLAKVASVKPRLGMRDLAKKVTETRYAEVFEKELKATIRSRRARKKSFSSKFGRLRYLRARFDVEGHNLGL